jgi:hypothetical protein
MESRRKLAAGLTIAAVLLIVAGVAAVAIDADFGSEPSGSSSSRPATRPSSFVVATPTPGSTTTPSTGPGNSPSSEPSPTPGVAPSDHPIGFVVSGKSIVYFTSDGIAIPMPAIAGLRTALVDDRALYYAVSPNAFGMKAGAYAGEFVPSVSMQQADGSSALTGGAVLVGRVATALVAGRLAQMDPGAPHWVVPLPVDIRGYKKLVDVGFDSFGLHGWSDTPRVVVRFTGQLPVTEIIPNNAGYHVLIEELGVTTWQAIDPSRLALPQTKLDADHLMNELLVYGTGAAGVHSDVRVDKPVGLGRLMLFASDEVSVSLVVRGSRADLGPDRILKVGDVPVFVASS